MKKVLTTLFLSSLFIPSYAQWIDGGTKITTTQNVGIGTDNPQEKLQIGNINNTENLKLSFPGAYNFEELKLGQYRNGASGIEFINHKSRTQSYGVRLYSDIDTGVEGLQIQTANIASSYKELSYETRIAIKTNGNIGIGTNNPQNKLDVQGTIRATEVKVETGWADFVFADDYKLPTLKEVEAHINEHKHLPDIPSEAEVKENGVSLGEMQAKLLQKIEELTLYTIELNKTVKEQGEKIQKLEAEKK